MYHSRDNSKLCLQMGFLEAIRTELGKLYLVGVYSLVRVGGSSAANVNEWEEGEKGKVDRTGTC